MFQGAPGERRRSGNTPTPQALLDALEGVKVRPVTDAELASVLEPLPPPMLSENWESSSDKCFIGPSFVRAIEGGHEGCAGRGDRAI